MSSFHTNARSDEMVLKINVTQGESSDAKLKSKMNVNKSCTIKIDFKSVKEIIFDTNDAIFPLVHFIGISRALFDYLNTERRLELDET